MRPLFAAFLCLFLLGGCAMTERLPRETLRVRAFDLSLRAREGSSVTIATNGAASERPVSYFNMRLDSAIWLESDRPVIIHTSELRSITIRDRQLGTLHGLAFGVGAGAAAGLGLGLALEGDPPRNRIAQTTLLAALVGGVIGEFVGFIIGAPVTYTVEPVIAE